MVLQINVYDELKDGCYVCPPSMHLYTWGEMEEMLSNTSAPFDELKELYDSYHDTMIEKIHNGLLAESFMRIDDKDFEFDDSLRDPVAAKRLFTKIFTVILLTVIAFFLLGFGVYVLFILRSMDPYKGMVLEIIVFLLAFFTMAFVMLRDDYVDNAKKRERKLKKFFLAKVTAHLTDRYGAVVMIFNTLMMYQLLEEKLKETGLI